VLKVSTTYELDQDQPGQPEFRQRGLWSWASRGILAQVDQAVVSGTNFLAMVLVGRTAGPSELGVYSLGLTILLITMATQESLISTPYLLRGVNLKPKLRSSYAASSLAMTVLLGLVVALPIMALGIAGRPTIASSLPDAAFVLAVILPFFLVRVFWRRYELAHERTRMALALDVIVTVCQLTLLGLLAVNHALTAVTGLGAFGVACIVASGAWALFRRGEVAFSRPQLLQDMLHSWHLGKWILASHVTMMLSIQAVQWVLVLMLDETATGLFVAPLTMVMIINPFLMGVTNVFLPASASALASGKSKEVRSGVHMLALFFVPLMAGFLASHGRLSRSGHPVRPGSDADHLRCRVRGARSDPDPARRDRRPENLRDPRQHRAVGLRTHPGELLLRRHGLPRHHGGHACGGPRHGSFRGRVRVGCRRRCDVNVEMVEMAPIEGRCIAAGRDTAIDRRRLNRGTRAPTVERGRDADE
jgi:hypothetical protein